MDKSFLSRSVESFFEFDVVIRRSLLLLHLCYMIFIF